MRRLLAGFLVIGLALTSCKSAYRVPNTAKIHYERTACFGTCPIYILTVDHTGLARFEGKQFTEKIGVFTKQLSAQETKQLFKQLSEEDWNSYKEQYKANVTDLPSTIFKFDHKKISKEVVVTGEHPTSLDVLSNTLSEIAESDGWTSTIEN